MAITVVAFSVSIGSALTATTFCHDQINVPGDEAVLDVNPSPV
jgi:hypothetical protein